MKATVKSSRGSDGAFWLSFSDMMSVLVLIFIFVIFSMLFTLNETETKYRTAQEEYAIAIARAESSENEKASLELQLTDAQTQLGNALTRAGELEEEKEQLIISIDSAESQLTEARNSLEATQAQLVVVTGKLNASEASVASLTAENDELSKQYRLLLQDKKMLESNAAALDVQIAALEAEIADKRAQYNTLLAQSQQNAALISRYESDIDSYRTQLTATQTQLEAMLGVKTQIVERLREELSAHNVSVQVDRQTGSLILPGGALFDKGQNVLKNSGKQFLDSFLPVYLNVILSDEFRPYIAEIVIEGHTDSSGKTGEDSYLYNMDLSQKRALAVADYIMDKNYMKSVLGLNASSIADLRKLISTAGRSYSALIYNSDGTENAEASRRVEIKFKLKDDATIEATRQLLELMGN